ncbi:MAG: 2-hydroxyglutaryl-CoA dehydratase [Deltaproteobacteria bacterium]|nr:2-hydroxyglutaryl-CoA dehydratase [Deltaproteobacteria bacterium]
MGIDIGSAFSKGVLLKDKEVHGYFECPSGGDFALTSERIKKELLSSADLSEQDIVYTLATGFGSQMVGYADEVKTDISCHAKGIHHFFTTARTGIDIGDLYSKVFRMDENGNVINFVLSGKCAGGSGRIFQVIAKVLQVKVEHMGPLSLKSKKRVDFSTGCAVFAESEAISRIAEGVSKEDLLAGIHRALAAQLHSMAERVILEKDLVMVGGGARDAGLVRAMEEITGYSVLVPPQPHMTAALGAALLALDSLEDRKSP